MYICKFREKLSLEKNIDLDCTPLKMFQKCYKNAEAMIRSSDRDTNLFDISPGSFKVWVECSPMVWETGVQSQVESYQRFKKDEGVYYDAGCI